jgi:4-hydroxy-2-oxovalerate aldolase
MKAKILDCTLRDGSYAVNFKFTKNDTHHIAKNLSESGIDLIEIGHGLGVGASSKTKYKSKHSDFDHMKVVKNIKNIKWGAFCIPGIADLDDIKKSIDYKPNFFRVGSNLEDYKKQDSFINLLKKNNIIACSNLMKSYTLKPKQFAKIAIQMVNMGADIVYIVDSAGGMSGDEVAQYFYEIKSINSKTKLGFHGHNNLGLANSNALLAEKLGFDIIDCTLQGIGRSAGNTVLEQFVATLIKKKKISNINLFKLLDLSEDIIVQKYKYCNIDSLDLIMGMSLFHSSYINIIKNISKRYDVDPRKLVIYCSKVNIKETNEKIAIKCAKKLAKQRKSKWKSFYKKYLGEEQSLEVVKC